MFSIVVTRVLQIHRVLAPCKIASRSDHADSTLVSTAGVVQIRRFLVQQV